VDKDPCHNLGYTIPPNPNSRGSTEYLEMKKYNKNHHLQKVFGLTLEFRVKGGLKKVPF
jgi:hypothetical protein